ncbi:MAG: hypothetical protein ACREFL_12875 [Stellaceae bacterium]
MVTAEPELAFDFDVTEPTGPWIRRGNHALWLATRPSGELPYLLHEWCEQGVRPFPSSAAKPVFHRIPEGTPYHISHLFGFWMANDVDAMLLTVPRGPVTHLMLVVGGRTGKPAEASALHVCPRCAARFGEAKFSEVQSGYERFLGFALSRVRAFNADERLRACPRCGAVHPPTYGFHHEADTPQERAAREAG